MILLVVTFLTLSLDFGLGQGGFDPEDLPPQHCNSQTGVCYSIKEDYLTWPDAWRYCGYIGGTLLVIDSQETLDFVTERLTKDFNGTALWIGVTDSVIPGVYYTTNGRVLSWAKWVPGQPDNNRFLEHCVAYVPSLDGFVDLFCADRRPFLCQTIRPGKFYCNSSDPSCAPWTNIGFDILPDMSCSNHNDFVIERPSLECTPLCQRAIHFICSSVEVSPASCRGTELTREEMREKKCLKADSLTDLHTRVYTPPYESKIYYQYTTLDPSTATWEGAVKACENAGFALLTIKSPEKDMLAGQRESWLALRNEGPPSWSYKWRNGTYPVYHNWGGDNANTKRDAQCAYRMSSREWQDRYCDQVLKFVCEYRVDAQDTTTTTTTTVAATATVSGEGPDRRITPTNVQPQTTTVDGGGGGGGNGSLISAVSAYDCDCFGRILAISAVLIVTGVVNIVLTVHIFRMKASSGVKPSKSSGKAQLVGPDVTP